MNIALVTVIYKRPELTDFVLSYYKEQKERLKNKINIELVCVGSEGDFSKNIAIKNGFEYHEYPNTPVSYKHNKVVEVCRNKNIDGVVYVGSDDIMDDVFYDEYINCINKKIDFLGFTDVYFLTEDHLGYWGGYKSNTPRYNEPIGPGKFYSKSLLDKLNWKPWGDTPLNKGLDGLCWSLLKTTKNISKTTKKCTDIGGHIIDIKTETNITDIKKLNFDYELGLDYIHSLKFNYLQIRNILRTFKTKKYDLSILISTYKNVNFITETLNSIFNSIGNFNVEILIGIDNCEETLNYVKQNTFIKNTTFYYFEKNLGPFIVINSLCQIARSENILFFSSDDVMTPNMIKNIITNLKTHQLVKTNMKNFKTFIDESEKMVLSVGIFAVKKDIFLQYNGFEPWRLGADSEFIKRMDKNKIKTFNSSSLDFYRRIHENSLIHSPETGVDSDIRKKYREILKNKTNFNPLSKLNTHPFKLVTPNGLIDQIVLKNKNKNTNKFYDISVIISTFDNVEYLKECFDSISNNQTDFNFEVLIGIDGCNKTLNYVQNNLFPDNFRFYYFNENNGPYVVYNTLSVLSSANKIMFFGSDDIMNNNLINNLIISLDKTDCFRCCYIDFRNPSDIKNNKSRSIEGGVFGIHTDVFDKLGGFRPWKCEGDSEFILRLTKNGFRIKTSNQIDFYRRLHNKGLTSRKDTGYLSELRRQYRLEYINDKNLSPLPFKNTVSYTIINEGKYLTSRKNDIYVKKTDTIGGMFNRVLQNKTNDINYEKVNTVIQDRQIQKEKTHSRPEKPVNENSNANAAKRAVVAKKPVKPVNSSPNSKIGKDFLRI